MKYEAVIGLEIHCELKTKTKIFCGCATGFGAEQNTHVCPVCLGLPGVLPTVNKRVVEFGIKAGLATNCTINKYSKFDRKNYYYPDLPKNWQTSQYDLPIAEHGWVDIDVDGEKKRIRLTRIHMEEDAGKLVHSGTTIKDSATSNVDYTARVCHSSRSSPSQTCVLRKRLAPTWRRSRPSWSTSTSRTAAWKRATCAPTSTSPCARSARKSSAPARR